MAINHNSSDEEVLKGGPRLFTGLSNFKVVAINPTLDELHGLGLNFQSEPKYTVNFGDGDLTKIVFWVTNKETTLSLEFLITPGPWKSKTDKVKWYDAKGNSCWAAVRADGSIEASDAGEFFDVNTAYIIPRGMDNLTDFVKAWANVAAGEECRLDTVDNIANGTITELTQLLNVIGNNEVRLLAYVSQDGKYNKIYSQYFGRVKPQRDDLFVKFLNKDTYNQIKGHWSVDWKPFSPAPLAPTPIPEGAEVTEADYLPDDDLGPLTDLPM